MPTPAAQESVPSSRAGRWAFGAVVCLLSSGLSVCAGAVITAVYMAGLTGEARGQVDYAANPSSVGMISGSIFGLLAGIYWVRWWNRNQPVTLRRAGWRGAELGAVVTVCIHLIAGPACWLGAGKQVSWLGLGLLIVFPGLPVGMLAGAMLSRMIQATLVPKGESPPFGSRS